MFFYVNIFIYTPVGFEVDMNPATKYMKQSLGFSLGYDATSLHREMVSLNSVSSEASELFVW